jgi:Xaa-Pro aminopeptidase
MVTILGYDTIAAAGKNACILHWIINDGDVKSTELVLLDAGVEVDSLYTADITRTLPVSGKFTSPKRNLPGRLRSRRCSICYCKARYQVQRDPRMQL